MGAPSSRPEARGPQHLHKKTPCVARAGSGAVDLTEADEGISQNIARDGAGSNENADVGSMAKHATKQTTADPNTNMSGNVAGGSSAAAASIAKPFIAVVDP